MLSRLQGASGPPPPLCSQGRHGLAAFQGHRLDQRRQRRITGALVKGAVAGQHFIEDHAQRVDVGATVHLLDVGRVASGQSAEMFGRHVGDGAAKHGLGLVAVELLRKIEVKQHRLAVAADQDVRRFDVPVEDAAIVGVLQTLGQPGHDPGGGLQVGVTSQQLQKGRQGDRETGRQARQNPRTAPSLSPCLLVSLSPCLFHRRATNNAQTLHELLASARQLRVVPQSLENARQAGAAEVGHAHRSQARLGILVNRVDRHDMRVLQLGQRLRLVPFDAGYLEHHGPAGQIRLFSQENSRERASAQLVPQPEAEQLVAHGWERQPGRALALAALIERSTP